MSDVGTCVGDCRDEHAIKPSRHTAGARRGLRRSVRVRNAPARPRYTVAALRIHALPQQHAAHLIDQRAGAARALFTEIPNRRLRCLRCCMHEPAKGNAAAVGHADAVAVRQGCPRQLRSSPRPEANGSSADGDPRL